MNTNQSTSHNTERLEAIRPMHTEAILKGLQELFDEAYSSDYIAAINTFARQRIERANQAERRDMYNLLKLMEILPRLERHLIVIKE